MSASLRFLEAAAAHGLEPDVHHFPSGTRSADDAARAVGCDVDQIVKSLVFMADGRAVLILTSGRNRVDEGRAATVLGVTNLLKATADQVKAATGYTIGGTPPLGHVQPLPTLMDDHLLTFAQVWAAAGTPDTCFPIDPVALREATGAQVAPLGTTR